MKTLRSKKLNKMKRKFSALSTIPKYFTRSQKSYIRDCLKLDGWVSATQTRNYMRNDHLVDWLKLKIPTNCSETSAQNDCNFLMNKGIEFENGIIEYLRQKFEIVTISDRIDENTIWQTKQEMDKGTPIIHSAPLACSKRRIRGIADLLIRSDWIAKLVDVFPIELDQTTKPYYLAIDIKFATLPLRADGIHILNSGNFPGYKAQMWIYNQILGDMQGYLPRFAFVLGRRWRCSQKGLKFGEKNSLSRLGVIDFKTVDSEYSTRTNSAIEWVRDVKTNGQNWGLSDRTELYPNLCVDSGKWNEIKKDIGQQIGDITQLWYCGVRERNRALEQGIKTWRDSRCTSETLGVNGKRGPILDAILNINRQNAITMLPNKISTNMYNWRTPTNEIFLDFETLNDIFSPPTPNQYSTDMIFMIGVYYQSDQKWIYRNFLAQSADRTEEFRIMDDFLNFYRTIDCPRIWYWHAETGIWNRACNRQFELTNNEKIPTEWAIDNWIDLAKIFRQEPIVIKNCFNFGLKNIAKCMYNHGMITTKLIAQCDSGLTASIKAWQAYNNSTASTEIFDDISRYNQFDVTVLQDILSYLRNNK